MSAKCKSCGADIIWARTMNEKSMPVDAAPNDDGNMYLMESPDPRDAPIVVSATSATLRAFDPPLKAKRHKSHFATCPHAGSHRK